MNPVATLPCAGRHRRCGSGLDDYGPAYASNDRRIAPDLLRWLRSRYAVIFTQDVNARARPEGGEPLGRLQVLRATTGGDLHAALLSGTLSRDLA